MAFPPQTPTRSPTRSPTYVPSAWKWDATDTADEILDSLQVETDGLVLDFLNNRTLVRTAGVDSASTPNALLTYTAPSAKYVMNNAATLVSASTIRTEYNAAGVAQGILIEEARTNLCLRSEEIDNASWQKLNQTITANSVVAPDGTTTADTIDEGSSNAFHLAIQATTATSSGTTYTLSAYFKKNTARYPYITLRQTDGQGHMGAIFDLDAGTASTFAGSGGNGTVVGATMTSVGNGWYRCTVTGSAVGTLGEIFIGISNVASGYVGAGGYGSHTGTNQTLYVWGVQVEAGSFATSYIKTTTATVTRAQDVITLATSAFPYADTHMALLEWKPYANANSFPAPMQMTGPSSDVIEMFLNSGGAYEIYVQFTDAGVSQASINGTAQVAGSVNPAAYRAALIDYALSVNGGAVATDGTGSLATVTTLYLGVKTAGSAGVSGHYQVFKFIPRAVTNANLVTEST
jgi:hypothetical protein